jgi:hypothetical protein
MRDARTARYSSAAAPEPEPTDPGHRLRVVFGAALASVLSGYVLAVVVAALAMATASAVPSPLGVLGAGVPLWLAAHQVPLTVTGTPLGVLPLVPTAGAVLLTANFAAAAVEKLGRRWGGDAAWVAATLAGTHGSLAVLTTALPTGPASAEPWPALAGAGSVAAAGAGLGLLRVIGPPRWWVEAPEWVRVGVRAAAGGAAALLTAGALMLLAALAAAATVVHDGFGMRPGTGVGIGVTVLSICYLPNALVAAVSWLAGPGVTIGAAVASPLAVTVGPLPPVPLFAAMPTAQPPGWAVVAFLLPIGVGIVTGLGCRPLGDDPMLRMRAAALAAAVVATGFAVLAAVVSGRLAAGPFDPVDLPAFSSALALFGWVGLPAALLAFVPADFRWPVRRRAAVPSEPALAGTGQPAWDIPAQSTGPESAGDQPVEPDEPAVDPDEQAVAPVEQAVDPDEQAVDLDEPPDHRAVAEPEGDGADGDGAGEGPDRWS